MKRVKKSITAVFILFLLFVIPFRAFSQLPDNWTKLPGETLQTLHDVAAFSSDILFTINEEGKIFATFDSGYTWRERNPQTGKELKFNALRINSNLKTIIAVGDDDAIYRSTNMGESWELRYFGSPDASGTVVPVSLNAITDDGVNYDEQIYYVVGQKGTILKSTNDGVDWEKKELNIGANQDLKFVSFMNPDTGFVANENGIIRTFDGGNSWNVVSAEDGITSLKTRSKFKAGKALADELVNITDNGTVIQTSTDYGVTWTKDGLTAPCDLLATGGVIFNKNQCEDLQNGLLVYGGGAAGKSTYLYMLSGNTFKGILQSRWENVKVEGIVMTMQTTNDHAVIAEAVTDSLGRFDLNIPVSFSGEVVIAALQSVPDPEYCYRPLPYDFGDVVLEPMEECDESTLTLRVINPTPVELNDLTVNGSNLLAVGNGGVVLTRTDEDADGDGYADYYRWSKQNSRTTENLLAATAYGIEKSDIRRGFIAAGNAGTIISTQSPGFEIVTPTVNDSLCTGAEITIGWTGGEPNWNVVVSVVDVNSWAVAAVVNTTTINDGNETWIIPSNFPPGSYQIYIQEENYITWTYGGAFTVNYCPTNTVCLEECSDNLILNWNFNENAVFGPMAWGSVSDWTNSGSPDVSTIKCNSADTVSIGMWGNQANAEFIFQTLDTPFTPGKTYSITFMGKWHTIPNRPYPVQFEFQAYNANMNNSVVIGVSNPLTQPEDWVIMSLPDWMATGSSADPFSVISVNATNHSSSMQPDSTSYGIIGALCIKEVTATENSDINSQYDGFKLGNNYPNPFGKSTIIEYSIPYTEKITIKIFDLYGREIETLVDKIIHAGNYQIEWDASGLPGGAYLCRMQAGRFLKVNKTILYK